jgi:hypothetical protein
VVTDVSEKYTAPSSKQKKKEAAGYLEPVVL